MWLKSDVSSFLLILHQQVTESHRKKGVVPTPINTHLRPDKAELLYLRLLFSLMYRMCVRLFIYLQIACRQKDAQPSNRTAYFLICVAEQKKHTDKKAACENLFLGRATVSLFFLSYSALRNFYTWDTTMWNKRRSNESQEIALNYSYKLLSLRQKYRRHEINIIISAAVPKCCSCSKKCHLSAGVDLFSGLFYDKHYMALINLG